MKQIGMAIAVAAAVVIGAARADEATPNSEGGRYVFSKQANGFLRPIGGGVAVHRTAGRLGLPNGAGGSGRVRE